MSLPVTFAAIRRFLAGYLLLVLALAGTAPSQVNLAQLLGERAPTAYEEVEKKRPSVAAFETVAFERRQLPKRDPDIDRPVPSDLLVRQGPFGGPFPRHWRGPPHAPRAPPTLA